MVIVKGADLIAVSLMATIVSGYVPPNSSAPRLIVIAEFAMPPGGGFTTEGVNVTVMWEGKPVTLSATSRLNDPIAVTVTIAVFDVVFITRLLGDTEIAKSPVSKSTLSVTTTQWVPEPSLAVTFSR